MHLQDVKSLGHLWLYAVYSIFKKNGIALIYLEPLERALV